MSAQQTNSNAADAIMMMLLQERDADRRAREEAKARKSPLGCSFWVVTLIFMVLFAPAGFVILAVGLLAHVYAKTRRLPEFE